MRSCGGGAAKCSFREQLPSLKQTDDRGRHEQWVAYLQGEAGEDVRLLDETLQNRQLVMGSDCADRVVSDPKLPANVAKLLGEIPQLEIETGFWERAGVLRANVLAKRRKARLGDALIAQKLFGRGEQRS